MIDSNDVQQIADRDVVGSDDKKIGKAGQVFLDDETGRPEWVTVNTGLFGTNESFVPLREASLTDDGVSVPYTKDQVKDAPNIDPDSGHITPEEESNLYEYYGISQDSSAVGGDDQHASGNAERHDHSDDFGHDGASDGVDQDAAAVDTDLRRDAGDRDVHADRDDHDRDDHADHGTGHDTSGPNTDEAMTRSEEQLKVGTATREAGKARLRKFVVTEEQTVTVPVQREEVTLEREPVTDANVGDATAGAEISEEEHEVTLHEEQVVVDKQAVPVERVKLGTETVTDEQQVTEEVRKEQIETEGVEGGARDNDGDARR